MFFHHGYKLVFQKTTDMRPKAPAFLLAALFLCLPGFVFNAGSEAQAADSAEMELAAVCVDELCGYVNSRGEWHIPPKFRAADPFSEDGLAFVITRDQPSGLKAGPPISKDSMVNGAYSP